MTKTLMFPVWKGFFSIIKYIYLVSKSETPDAKTLIYSLLKSPEQVNYLQIINRLTNKLMLAECLINMDYKNVPLLDIIWLCCLSLPKIKNQGPLILYLPKLFDLSLTTSYFYENLVNVNSFFR